MSLNGKFKFLLGGLLIAAAASPSPLWACAACYGASDSPMAAGMNWGIFSLLVVVVSVLGGIAACGVYFVRRSAAVSATAAAGAAPSSESAAPASSSP
jgi:hypothetical protein